MTEIEHFVEIGTHFEGFGPQKPHFRPFHGHLIQKPSFGDKMAQMGPDFEGFGAQKAHFRPFRRWRGENGAVSDPNKQVELGRLASETVISGPLHEDGRLRDRGMDIPVAAASRPQERSA